MDINKDELIEEFDKFISKWCGNLSAHLLDSDDNDGEEFRDKIRGLKMGKFKPVKNTMKQKSYVVVAIEEDLKDWDVLATCSEKHIKTTYDFCKKEYPNLTIKVLLEVEE